MKRWLPHIDRALAGRPPAAILALCLVGVLVVGAIDYLLGYEVSVSIFYLGPVAVAAWYAGRRAASAIAVASCISWYVADIAAGHPYSHPAIPVWNALVRFGFFLITGLLLAALRDGIDHQRRLARTDALTGLHSRRAFEERLEHDLALARRRDTALSITYIDLDDFKSINDTHGHAAGDRVLKALGRALSRCIRESDIAARLGGDEFALLLPEADADGARRVVDKVRAAVADALGRAQLACGCSVGVVTFLQPPASAAGALAAADALMYEVKRREKGAVGLRVFGATAEPSRGEERPEAPPSDPASPVRTAVGQR